MNSGPTPGNLHPFSQIIGIILLLISLWNFSSVQLLSHVWLFVTPWTVTSLPLPITEPIKANHATFSRSPDLPSAMDYTVCGVCFSQNLNKSTSYHFISEFFLWWDIKNLCSIRSWNQVWWVLSESESQPEVKGFSFSIWTWEGVGDTNIQSIAVMMVMNILIWGIYGLNLSFWGHGPCAVQKRSEVVIE